MKRKSSVLLIMMAVFMLTFTLNSLGFAAPNINSSKIIFQKEVITDTDALFDRAVKGITDKNGGTFTPNAIAENKETGEKIPVKTFSTTQLAKQENLADGSIKNTYVTTSFAVLSFDGSQYKHQWDGAYSVDAYSTIYWNEVYYSGDPNKYISLYKADGGWTINDNSVAVSNKKATIGQTGLVYNGVFRQYSQTYSPSGLTFSYDAPNSWLPVFYINCVVGCTTSATITRGGSSWSLNLINNYADRT